MKTHLKQIMLALTLVFTFASCSSDDDKGSVNKSRDVKLRTTLRTGTRLSLGTSSIITSKVVFSSTISS